MTRRASDGMRLLLALAALATLAALAAVNAGPAGEVGDDAGRAGATATVVLSAALAPSEKLLVTLVRERLRQVSHRAAVFRTAEAAQAPAAREAALRGVWDDLKALVNIIVDVLRLLLDPAPLGDFYFRWENTSLLTGNLTLLALNARHLRDVNVQAWHPNVISMCLGVDFALPEISLDAFYDVDVTINLESDANGDTFRIFGKGPARIDLSNITLSTDICLSLKNFGLEVKNLRFSVKNTDVDLQYLFGEREVSKLISGIATDIIPTVIQDFQKELTEYIMKLINNYIKGRLPAVK